jgi:hypothetical protein
MGRRISADRAFKLRFRSAAGYGRYGKSRGGHDDFEGDVDYENTEDFTGEGDDFPTDGLFVIYGALDALIDVIPDPNGVDVDLEIDLDGNGTPEGLEETTWEELLGLD